MSNFYVKIKKMGNEIEFSSDDENIFNSKLNELLQDFMKLKIQPQQEIQEIFESNPTQELCDFVEIKQPEASLNEIQNNENNKENFTIEFEQILENAQETPILKFSEPENNNAEFSAFIASQNPQNSMDYLIFSAQYFVKYLNQQNFTLKQINSKLVPAKNIAISHKDLSEAQEQGWIELVPDLTETSVNKEYTLTVKGEHEYGRN